MLNLTLKVRVDVIDKYRQTGAGKDNTWRPELAPWENSLYQTIILSVGIV